MQRLSIQCLYPTGLRILLLFIFRLPTVENEPRIQSRRLDRLTGTALTCPDFQRKLSAEKCLWNVDLLIRLTVME